MHNIRKRDMHLKILLRISKVKVGVQKGPSGLEGKK